MVWNNFNSKQVNLPRLEHLLPHTAEVSSHFSPGIHSWEVFWGNCSLAWAVFSSWLSLVSDKTCWGYFFLHSSSCFSEIWAIFAYIPSLGPALSLKSQVPALVQLSCWAEISLFSLSLAGSSWVNFYQFGCSYLLWCCCSSISSSLPSTQPDTGSAQPWGNSSPGSVPVFGASLWHVIASHIAGEVLERHRSLSLSGAL